MSVTRTQLNEAITKNWHEQKVMLESDNVLRENAVRGATTLTSDGTYRYMITPRWEPSTTEQFFRPTPIFVSMRRS